MEIQFSSDEENVEKKERKLKKNRRTSEKQRRVGRYTVGDIIGQGAFGVVRIATKSGSSDKFALKFLGKDNVTDVDEVQRVFRESAILTSLKNPNVIRLHEVIDEAKHIVMVMEYAPGGELFDLISENGPLSERDACGVFHQIINAVEYCHRKKVIHRDLKLENILLAENESMVIKVADFGLSNTAITGKKSGMGTACGTPSYSSPEQVRGELDRIGAPADMWALGVILYAMCAGFLPFEAKSQPALFRKILNLEYSCPDFFSDDLRDIIQRLLTVESEERATITEIKSHPWYMMELSDLAASLTEKVSMDDVREAREKIHKIHADKKPKASRSTSLNITSDLSDLPSGDFSSQKRPTHSRIKSMTIAGAKSGSAASSRRSSRSATSSDSRRKTSVLTGSAGKRRLSYRTKAASEANESLASNIMNSLSDEPASSIAGDASHFSVGSTSTATSSGPARGTRLRQRATSSAAAYSQPTRTGSRKGNL